MAYTFPFIENVFSAVLGDISISGLFILVPPVLSAFLGAIAIKLADKISSRRKGFTAIHNEIVENYWRIGSEIRSIDEDEWEQAYINEVRYDGIEAVKAHSPGVYIEVVDKVDDFPAALTSLERLRENQKESRRAGVEIGLSSTTIRKRLERDQSLMKEVEENLRDYRDASPIRRLLLWSTMEAPDYEYYD